MEARLHYSTSRTLLHLAPTASPSPAPAAPGIPDARPAAAYADAIIVLALLICGLVAAIALHVVLQCACYGAGDNARQEPPRAGGHRAGQARHGGRKRALVQALPCLAYSAALELVGSSRSECAICLAEFARGEQVRVLPRCNHGFHEKIDTLPSYSIICHGKRHICPWAICLEKCSANHYKSEHEPSIPEQDRICNKNNREAQTASRLSEFIHNGFQEWIQ